LFRNGEGNGGFLRKNYSANAGPCATEVRAW